MRGILIALIAAAAASIGMAAETYPVRPIRAVVPNPPGGANDTVGRIVIRKMSEALGQQIVVDNRGGAGGAIGAEIAARATPDGYTVLVATFATHTMVPHLQKKIAYDPLRDFEPIALFVVQYALLTASPGFPPNTVKELVAYGKSRPGQINYGSAGPGSTSDFMGRMFARVAGIELTIVPYKGGGLIPPALIQGEVQFNFGPIPAMASHVRAGRLKGIAVSGPKRSLALPDLPTVAESGLPDFSAAAWVGLAAPKGTPRDRVERLASVSVQAVNNPETRERLVRTGADPDPRPTTEFGKFLREEYARYGKIVRELGLKPD
ncbi:MAG TPA: tripartite tricarboxylate transporter substrate binding protein [Burkholderiales bacterium]|jgi:tripartite-type tricarboxylate transporter receptor subunit TctC|nr:tripartite tricarboxylate transporter substrate binding protein [Burkholderiales bacterium]